MIKEKGQKPEESYLWDIEALLESNPEDLNILTSLHHWWALSLNVGISTPKVVLMFVKVISFSRWKLACLVCVTPVVFVCVKIINNWFSLLLVFKHYLACRWSIRTLTDVQSTNQSFLIINLAYTAIYFCKRRVNQKLTLSLMKIKRNNTSCRVTTGPTLKLWLTGLVVLTFMSFDIRRWLQVWKWLISFTTVLIFILLLGKWHKVAWCVIIS